MTNWIETVTGSLEQKKQWKAYRVRVEALPEPYHGVVELHFARRELVGLSDRDRAGHAGEALEESGVERAGVSRDAHHGPLDPGQDVRAETQLFHGTSDPGKVLPAAPLFHHNDHRG